MRSIAAFLLACVCFAGSPADAQTGPRVGEVAGLTGPATVLRDGAASALRLGAPVHRSDRLVTLAGAKLRVLFDDGSELVVGADSKVAVARYAPDEGQGLLQLIRGILRTAIHDAGAWQRFEVETRSAVASARSTEWVVALSDDGTAVFVVDGTVAVRGAGEEVRLGPGDGTDVPPDGPPNPPVQWGQARVDRVLARTTLP